MEICSVYKNTRIFGGIFVDYIHRSQCDQMIFEDDKRIVSSKIPSIRRIGQADDKFSTC